MLGPEVLARSRGRRSRRRAHVSRTPSTETASFQAWRRARRRRLLRPVLVAGAIVCLLAGRRLGRVLLVGVLPSDRHDRRARAAVEAAGAESCRVAGRPVTSAARPGSDRRAGGAPPPVADATVTRRWPHRLVIKVTERRPVAAVATGATGRSSTSTVWRSRPSRRHPRGLVPVHVGAAMADGGSADARAALTVYRTLPPRLRRQVVELRATSPATGRSS